MNDEQSGIETYDDANEDNRRQHKRTAEELDIMVLCNGWRFPVIARTVNISDGGYMLITQYAIRVDAPVLLLEVGARGFEIDTIQEGKDLYRAEVRWCTDMPSMHGYAWGLERV